MPKREDIKKILLLGSGPIVIGQACEFDYSGTQACKALKEEGYEVVLVNSNPATIMTDPEFADKTYIEPLTSNVLTKIIAFEKPDAILPTLGGQTALNLAVELAEQGILEQYNVEMLAANLHSIKKAEDRELFKDAMLKIGLELPKSGFAKTMEQAKKIINEIGFPVIIRPSFTLGGTGGNIAYNFEEYEEYVRWGLDCSPVTEILIEESVVGWKEYELEVMRDRNDNVVIICSIENLDPMGVHTGDSITIAPAQTLTDKEYQILRDASIKVIREIGVDTGGSNIQFAVNPDNGKLVIIEMNPRVSRSSALASKATGFPIAKIAAKLAVGYTLDEIKNDITKETPASFEPTIDYVVTKIPRFTFEKFPEANKILTTQMKSVGEVMAIGRTFKESLQKAMRSLEEDTYGFDFDLKNLSIDDIKEQLRVPNSLRLWHIGEAFKRGFSIEEIFNITLIDKWFLFNIKEIIDSEKCITPDKTLNFETLKELKEQGFSDIRIGELCNKSESDIRALRKSFNIMPVYKMVDTCGAEFKAYTPYLYSTYEQENESTASNKKKVMILGGGPNRIGQGIEFDYCCVHAVFALKEEGYEAIMVNCNPETVSTDYDISDKLYFEPLTYEDVMNIVENEKPDGIIVQFGGQTPLKLASHLKSSNAPIIGTDPDNIDKAEDRERFKALLNELNLKQPDNDTALNFREALKIARRIGFPVLVRPSYVLGGRAMEIVHDEKNLENYMRKAVKVSYEHPVLIDKFLTNAIEIDVDSVSDGKDVIIAGIMEHIEGAGIHSGDSACSLPPYSLSPDIVSEIKRQTVELALKLEVKGLMNVQYAVKDGEVYILEVNPRASRTVPFVSKATGIPFAKIAAKIMIGKTIKELGVKENINPPYYSVKEAVFPFSKFVGVDPLLGPEMKSTGEVMGIDHAFPSAFLKAQIAAGNSLPESGKVLITMWDKNGVEQLAKDFMELGFEIYATSGTSLFLDSKGIPNKKVLKVQEGRPNIVDFIKNREIDLIVNSPADIKSKEDSTAIRSNTIIYNIPYFTTLEGARAATMAIRALKSEKINVKAIQMYHG